MNSRSSVNEANLVNFSADITSLNPLDTKEPLLSFPFDHIYACHSASSDERPTLQLDKEIEISTQCVVAEDKEIIVDTNNSEVSRLSERLTIFESQNRKLKDLLIYHLDLIQQQNDLITKREKLYQALKQENDALKSKYTRPDKKATVNQRHSVNPPPLVHVAPTSTITSTVIKTEPNSSSQIMFNSFTELLLPDTSSNPFLFNSDITKPKPFGQDAFDLSRNAETDVTSYLSGDLGLPSILDPNLNCDNFTMIENKRSATTVKKDIKTETRAEPLYTVTTNSGNPVIQKNQRSRRRTSGGIGSLSRMPKTTPKTEVAQTSKIFDDDKTYGYTANKKSKMISTYGKSRSSNLKKSVHYTGSLSERFRLIDTPPSGEDPYQLGEADLREQSPIPKLMLQKTNHGRMKVCTGTQGEKNTTTSRRIYDTTPERNIKGANKIKLERKSTYTHTADIKNRPAKTMIVEEPDLDLVKTEPEIDWRIYSSSKLGSETSLCDFSYGETASNLATNILPSLDTVEFQDLFSAEPALNLDSLNTLDFIPTPDKLELSSATPLLPPIMTTATSTTASTSTVTSEKTKRRGARTTSLIGPNAVTPTASADEQTEHKRGGDSKRGRKRALSTTGVAKAAKRDPTQKPVGSKPKLIKGKATCRGKKTAMPGMMTTKQYHTQVGDPDLSWYLGLDPEVKMEDVDQGDSKASTVEVPRWREKPYTSCYTLEGTENLDDKVFEKRHQKLEAEERRQLRWHMRRVREQRHVERLRQRQRDSWCSGSASPAHHLPSSYTIWPQPQRDVHFIEITDTLPVNAFGEPLPALPETDFVLPWVRTSKPLKRSKRSKTLH